jgi:uncharacterized protein
VPTQRVNDYARLLSAEARQRLEGALAERERATGAQMVVAIFPSLEGESLEDFGIRLGERWRVGDKRLDRGVILLVFVQERRVRLEVGYGLEPVLPDAAAGQIIREAIAPRFRAQQYAAGLEAAVEAVFARIETRGAPPEPRRRMSPWALGLLVVFGVVVLMLARDAMSGGGRARRNVYTAGGRRGWGSPVVMVPPIFGGWGRGGGRGGGGGIFRPGGGGFGGGGASGQW